MCAYPCPTGVPILLITRRTTTPAGIGFAAAKIAPFNAATRAKQWSCCRTIHIVQGVGTPTVRE